ncbi:MAG TPA: TolC family protein, partial [Gemmata sp.]|nr:TolC family protein [Gemmata sp.]
LAQQLSARVLLLPNLNIGGNYHYNNGPVQTSSGQILPVADQALYMGFGAGAVGAGSVAIPGMWLSAHLGDAVYEPLAARENVAARRSDSVATQNAIMGDVVTAYLRLVGSEARLDVLRRGDVEGAEVVRLTAEFSKAGEGLPADANRARAFDKLVERERHAAEEEVEVASAQLCRLLNIDPSNHFRTPGASLEPFRLIPEDTDVEVLIAQAMQARPELATRYANIREAQIRVRQEKIRPFLPTVSVGVSTAAFGGQSNLVSPSFSPLASRTDIDAMAIWNLQNLGFGNRARVREANAVFSQALAEYDSTKNRIRRGVLEALADAQAAARQLELARSAVSNSTEGFQLDLLRIKGGAGKAQNAPRPIDLLDSFKGILEARQELVAAVTGFDIAQFRLFVAIGSNPLNGPDVSRAAPAIVPNVPMGTVLVSPKPTPILPPLTAPGKP